MKILGLISGGKDSCFNLMHCVANGHKVVALGNLRPKPGVEELDSPLYQTVGHGSVEAIAEAFDLPFYTRTIKGESLDQSSQYRKHQGDETEDLTELVKEALYNHPDIEGVSSGAVLSNYQRVRVENVCSRLGLMSLSYLWQRDQSQLLSEMAMTKMKSIIIKVSGAGLRLRHLGLDVLEQSVQEELNLLKDKFGLHPAGEGGEYETFTIYSPMFKNGNSVEIVKSERVLTSTMDDIFSTVAHLKILNAVVIKRGSYEERDQSFSWTESLVRPPLLCEEMRNLESSVLTELSLKGPCPMVLVNEPHFLEKSYLEPTISISDTMIVLGNITAFNSDHTRTSSFERIDVYREVRSCLKNILSRLNTHEGFVLSSISLFLSKEYMEMFATINKTYGEVMKETVPPPVRAAVAVILPDEVGCVAEAIAHKSTNNSERMSREGLHVQGLSYWAPACIGPYSQAISVCEDTFISGQIAMNPANLNLVETGPPQQQFLRECVLSLQHVTRVYEAVSQRKISYENIRGGICWIESGNWSEGYRTARLTWDHFRRAISNSGKILVDADAVILFVGSELLPKKAGVEWQMVCERAEKNGKGDGDDEEDGGARNKSRRMHTRLFHSADDALNKNRALASLPQGLASVRIFCTANVNVQRIHAAAREMFPGLAITAVGVRYVANAEGEGEIGMIFY